MFEGAIVPVAGAGGGAPEPASRLCVVCGVPAALEFGTGCRAHVVAAAALHPGRSWRGDIDGEVVRDEGLRGRIAKAARVQSGEEERRFFPEDVGTDSTVGGRWVGTVG